MSDRLAVLDIVNEIKKNSKEYQEHFSDGNVRLIDELGGHIGYLEKEQEYSFCPSEEFVEDLFQKCARELGIDYEK